MAVARQKGVSISIRQQCGTTWSRLTQVDCLPRLCDEGWGQKQVRGANSVRASVDPLLLSSQGPAVWPTCTEPVLIFRLVRMCSKVLPMSLLPRLIQALREREGGGGGERAGRRPGGQRLARGARVAALVASCKLEATKRTVHPARGEACWRAEAEQGGGERCKRKRAGCIRDELYCDQTYGALILDQPAERRDTSTHLALWEESQERETRISPAA